MVAVHTADHPVELRGAWSTDTPGKPLLIRRTESDFVSALLADLKSSEAESRLAGLRVPIESGRQYLRLFQPVHRVFNLALMDVHCDTLGQPRLNPLKIESAGMVIRRLAEKDGKLERDRKGRCVYEGWRSLDERVQGWVRFPEGGVQEDCDPLPERRCVPRLTGDAAFDRQASAPALNYAEAVTPMFVVPPDVASACHRTVVFGVVPVTSSERATQPEPPLPIDEGDWQGHLSLLLKSSTHPHELSWPSSVLDPSQVESAAGNEFLVLLQQLGQEFGAFQEDSAPSQEILRQLDQLEVKLRDGTRRAAGHYLKSAAGVLLMGEKPSTALPAPQTWPKVSTTLANRVDRALKAAAEETRKTLLATPGRFDDPARLYVMRAFIRVRQPNDCPAKLVWSAPSDPFQIAPWHQPGPVAPAPIQLPDLTPEALRAAKPGVMFSVPKALFNLLRGNPKDLLDGKQPSGGLQLDWLCGFNIPVITICAFLLLNIILSILNLIFWWLPFVKICIPFPRKK